ncbi:hypothetical protein [Candidatus Uabimicrobium sp. HlEnr_7]|uniref:hypothetical protein n=1 Tax=Candidatus Uabimicrobium helgolandensis TaxID=3095367 RepID=UPI0035567224
MDSVVFRNLLLFFDKQNLLSKLVDDFTERVFEERELCVAASKLWNKTIRSHSEMHQIIIDVTRQVIPRYKHDYNDGPVVPAGGLLDTKKKAKNFKKKL